MCAHELAHQWFGNLVTTVWWDDLWLNESFASWLATKIVDQWKPEWQFPLSRMGPRFWAMSLDSLVSTRKIRQPIESKHDIPNAFDSITYEKGEAVLRMFERWLGADSFRKGVQQYLGKHAWGTATATGFLAALSEAAGSNIVPAFSTFLDQAGVPLVSVNLQCQAGAPGVRLTQKRFLPLGSQGSSSQIWSIPICLKYDDAERTRRQCVLMTDPRMEVVLDAAACPGWVFAHEDGTGYYRAFYEGDLSRHLLNEGASRLSVAERIAVLHDLAALLQAGDVAAAEALALAAKLAADSNPHIVTATLEIVGKLEQYHLVSQPMGESYSRFVRHTYGPRARQLGWKPQPGEDEETQLSRPRLAGLVAGAGEDQELIGEAKALVQRWLEDRRAIDPEVLEPALRVAARNGDRALFERFRAEAKKTQDRRERRLLLQAMGTFRDPEIIRTSLALLLTDEFDARESRVLLWGPLWQAETRQLPWEFVRQNFDALNARLPRFLSGEFGARLPFVGRAFCSGERRAEVESFFPDRIANLTGGPRNLAQTLETIRLCSAVQNAQRASAEEFLKNYQAH